MKQKRIELISLPYAYSALEPIISQQTLQLHHTRHHLGYVTGANAAMNKLEKFRQGELDNLDFKATLRDLSFHLNGVRLHNLFWYSMRPPQDNNQPSGDLLALIKDNFVSFEVFQREFSQAANQVEGSGWAVLVIDPQTQDLHVLQLQNHNLLGVANMPIILALDVWEHAYYLDYQNNRNQYVEKWWSLVNWDNVAERVKQALS